MKALLTIGQWLISKLKDKEETSMASFQPKFSLIGSVAEGTRLDKASEIDVTVELSGLEDTPLIIRNGSELEVVEERSLF